ncbi:Protein of unknown function [Pyronema omphalodes CBS 100304]|uniref:Uncharacterized protein n=1 Tax=Pyronema omphalodes (strain CBS 100304) TaxID=1076935 RepID=U4LQW5_PYROM|nr:Protein of unknown function [Pyronema omphalodes CBS 100304]
MLNDFCSGFELG